MNYITLQESGFVLDFSIEKFVLDFSVEKGQSVEPLYITVTGEDFRDCLVFGEIRRASPGKQLVSGFTANTVANTSKVGITYFGDPSASKPAILQSLGIKAGDRITVEGSGVDKALVISVSSENININATSTVSVSNSRLFYYPGVEASFLAAVSAETFTINADTSTVNNVISVSNLVKSFPQGSKLVFNAGATIKEVTLTEAVASGSATIKVNESTNDFSSSYVSHCGTFTLITTASASGTATSIATDPLFASIPSGHELHFGFRNDTGWRYAGKAVTTAPALKNATSISVNGIALESYLSALPSGSIAWFSNFPFNRFYIALDPKDMTTLLASQDYGYDIMLFRKGIVTLLGRGKIKFTDNYTDTTDV
jgi:hypothetical protein